jgi:hypothetical protein
VSCTKDPAPVESSALTRAQGYIWSNLPDLAIYLSEHWQKVTFWPWYPGYRSTDNIAKAPSEGRWDAPEELDEWKKINSFISRLGDSGYAVVLNLGIWGIRTALEDTVPDAPALLNCRLWVAAEWIVRCSGPLLWRLTAPKDPGEKPIQTELTGTLYGEGLPPWNLQRWEFWKERLTLFAGEHESFGLVDETTQHIHRALETMKGKM